MEEKIDILEKVRIGGLDQWILTLSKNINNPILLFLHGGPGTVSMPLADHYDNDLLNNFTLVHWDQRGAGKSYYDNIPKMSMRIEQFISDARYLIKFLLKKYKKNKLYLVGQSWGSAIGISIASRYPDLLYAYVGIGQVVDMLENEKLSYKLTLECALKENNKKAIKELIKIGHPPYKYSNNIKKQKWIVKLGHTLHKQTSYTKLMKHAIFSHHYTWRDFIKYFKGSKFSSTNLWREGRNFTIHHLRSIEVPVYFIEGRHDFVTPTLILQKYLGKLNAPKGKKLFIFENSAHAPNYEEPDRFHKVLVMILKETYNKK